MADSLYALEKLGQALSPLTLGKGRIKERLIAACENGFVQVSRNALPTAEMQNYYDKIWLPVTRVKNEQRGSFAASIDEMKDEAAQLALYIESLESMLRVHVRDR